MDKTEELKQKIDLLKAKPTNFNKELAKALEKKIEQIQKPLTK